MTPVAQHEGRAVVRSGNTTPSPFLVSTMKKLGAMKDWHGGQRCCLDIGSGNGRNSKFMKELGFEVVSLDWAPGYGLKYDLLQKALPVFSSSVDVVLLQYVLMFLPEDERHALVADAARIMRPMGIAVVEFYNAKESFCPTLEESRAACCKAAHRFEASGRLILNRSKDRFIASGSNLSLN